MFSWTSDAPDDGRWDTLPQVPSAVPSNWMAAYGEMYTTFLRSVASYPVSMCLMTLRQQVPYCHVPLPMTSQFPVTPIAEKN